MRQRQLLGRLRIAVAALVAAGCREASGPVAPAARTLAVARGPGVSGVPASGSASYQNGATVPYTFQADSGYEALQVVLDSTLVPASGSISMTQDHTLMASASHHISLPPASDPLVQQISALLTATDPVTNYRALLRQFATLYQQLPPEEASQQITAAEAVAYDPVRDSIALNRMDATLSGHVFTDDSFPILSAAARSQRTQAATSGSTEPTILYVNGVLNDGVQAGNTFLYLQKLLVLGGPIPPYHVHYFYNYGWKANPNAGLAQCLSSLASPGPNDLLVEGFSAWLPALQLCVANPLEGFTTVLANQTSAFLETYSPGPLDEALAAQIQQELNAGREVVIVPHSHGNLVTVEALKDLVASAPVGTNPWSCIGVVSLASPITSAWPPSIPVSRLVVKGRHVKDWILLVNPTFTPPPTLVSTDISDNLDNYVDQIPVSGNVLFNALRGWRIVLSDLDLHHVNESYLAGQPTQQMILSDIDGEVASLRGKTCVEVGSVTITPAVDTVPVGQTVQLTATLKDAAGNVLTGRSVTWASSDPTVATVSGAGLVTVVLGSGAVTVVSPGIATVTATSEGTSGTAQITVPVASVTVTPAVDTLPYGTAQLTATPKDASGDVLTERVVTWASSDPTVATVSGSGLVKVVAVEGLATITATSEGKGGTARIIVPPFAIACRSGSCESYQGVRADAAVCVPADTSVDFDSFDALTSNSLSVGIGGTDSCRVYDSFGRPTDTVYNVSYTAKATGAIDFTPNSITMTGEAYASLSGRGNASGGVNLYAEFYIDRPVRYSVIVTGSGDELGSIRSGSGVRGPGPWYLGWGAGACSSSDSVRITWAPYVLPPCSDFGVGPPYPIIPDHSFFSVQLQLSPDPTLALEQRGAAVPGSAHNASNRASIPFQLGAPVVGCPVGIDSIRGGSRPLMGLPPAAVKSAASTVPPLRPHHPTACTPPVNSGMLRAGVVTVNSLQKRSEGSHP